MKPRHSCCADKLKPNNLNLSSVNITNGFFSTGDIRKDLGTKAIRGSAAVLAAEIISSILRFVSMAVLARLLMPGDFGLLAMVTAVTLFAERIKDIGLGDATIQARHINHDEVNSLFWINLLVCIAIALLLTCLSKVVAWFYKDPRLTAITIIIASTFLFSGLVIQHQALLRRQLRFGSIASIQLFSIIVSSILAILLAYRGFGYWSLVAREFSRAVIVVIGTWIRCPWRPSLPKRGIKIKHLITFGKHMALFNLVTFFSASIDKLLLGKLFGSQSVGLYTVSGQIIGMPISMLQNPLITIALPAMSAIQYEPSKFLDFQKRMLQTILFFTMPVVVFVAIFADVIVGVIIGVRWVGAAPLLRIFAIGAFFEPMGFTIGPALAALGRTKEYLRLGLIVSILRVACLGVGSFWGTTGVAYGSLTGVVLSLAVWLLLGLKNTPVRISDVLRGVIPAAICSLGTGLALALIQRYSGWGSHLYSLAIFMMISLVIYLLLWIIIPGGISLLRDNTKYLGILFSKIKKRTDAS